MSDLEKRSECIVRKIETRVEEKQEGGKKLVLRGYPILFNTETTIWDFWYGEITEIILPTALDKTDLTNVLLLRGHDPDKLLGRNHINMRLEVDDVGLFFECELSNSQVARDAYNDIEVGLLDGMSFGFRCSDEVNPETRKRTITQIDELYEITITPFPAYKEASVVAQTAAEKEKQLKLAQEEKEKQNQEIDEKLKELEDM